MMTVLEFLRSCVRLGVLAGALVACDARSSLAQRPATPTVRLLLLGQSLVEHDPRGLLPDPLGTLLPALSSADVVFTNFEGAVKGDGCV